MPDTLDMSLKCPSLPTSFLSLHLSPSFLLFLSIIVVLLKSYLVPLLSFSFSFSFFLFLLLLLIFFSSLFHNSMCVLLGRGPWETEFDLSNSCLSWSLTHAYTHTHTDCYFVWCAVEALRADCWGGVSLMLAVFWWQKQLPLWPVSGHERHLSSLFITFIRAKGLSVWEQKCFTLHSFCVCERTSLSIDAIQGPGVFCGDRN